MLFCDGSNSARGGGGDNSPHGFETGGSFDPVTTGVDVAIRPLPDGGALIVGDCEGAFHLCGSAQSARGFGALGVIAYSLSSTLVHVSMGSIDERDIESLGSLAAAIAPGHRAGPMPSLLLLVNGARFDLGDAVARRFLRPREGDGSRWCSRAAIAQGFSASALEALPACDHAAYWPKVAGLRRRILATPLSADGQEVSGAALAQRLVALVTALNGAPAPEPEASTEALCRARHLEPLVEEIAKSFAKAAAGPKEGPRSAREALAEFDRRAPKGLGVRPGLVADARGRLAARLSGITEAMARGRATREPVGPENPEGPKDPPTPSTATSGSPARERGFAMLEAAWEEAQLRLEVGRRQLSEEVAEMRASVAAAREAFAALLRSRREGDRKAASAVSDLQERFREGLREAAAGRAERATQAAAERCLNKLRGELQSLEASRPDLGRCAAQLGQAREALEALRLARREALEVAAQALEAKIQALRGVLEEAAQGSATLTAGASRWAASAAELRDLLQEERREREDRYAALAAVVLRMRASLEASASEAMELETGQATEPQQATLPPCPVELPRPLSGALRGLAAPPKPSAYGSDEDERPHRAVRVRGALRRPHGVLGK